MYTKQLLTTTTQEERDLIEMVMERARKKAKGLKPLTQKERGGERGGIANGLDTPDLKPSSHSHREGGAYG